MFHWGSPDRPSREAYGRAEKWQRGALGGKGGGQGQQDAGRTGAQVHRQAEQHVAGERQVALVADGMPRQPAHLREDVLVMPVLTG